MVATLGSTGVLQIMHTLRYLQNRNTFARSSNNTGANLAQPNTSNTNRPFYSKKPWPQKPKMSNSFELLTGPIEIIQKKYEILSDIVIVEYGGKVHGSQSHIFANNNSMQLIVYYEVPLGQRDEVKQKFNNIVLQRNY
jgi:hypothetical protein